uniref:Cytochrome P450 76AD17 n=1 Tax=Mollugo verticillata TaxID=3592 RepID=A0A0X9R6K1_MOLVE|nr:cytochrome P450 76AD17 [Mollugo verticillata]
MDQFTLGMILSFLFVWFYLVKTIFGPFGNASKIPPGPTPLPIVGNIFQLGKLPHRSFSNLSKIYGSMMTLKLGMVTTIVVSSAEVAKEMFLQHDLAFSNRMIPDSVTGGKHDKLSVTWIPVSPKWRHLRKIFALNLLSNQKLDETQSQRQAKVQQLLEYVQECAKKGCAVDIGRATFTTTLNLLSNTVFSMELAHYSSNASQEFKRLMWCIMEEIGRPNYADYFPFLRHFDPFGNRRRLTAAYAKLIGFFENIVHERLNARSAKLSTTNDVLDTLLNLHQDNQLTMDEIYHILVDIFDAGTDTTANTLEFAMAQLVKNPETLVKAQTEIEQALGKSSSIIQESDISKLPYLQAIIKETFRLHPPAVFLLPRKAETDITLCGYVVPKNAQIMLNLWSIGRDPKVWQNPEVFSPERFLNCDIDVRGRHFELLPFGAGRRICPGITLSYRMLHLMLAALIRSFDWKLEDGTNPKDLDVTEKFGIALQKAEPLEIVPVPKTSLIA